MEGYFPILKEKAKAKGAKSTVKNGKVIKHKDKPISMCEKRFFDWQYGLVKKVAEVKIQVEIQIQIETNIKCGK